MAIATSFSGCARLAEAMGRHTQLPPVFGRTSRRVLAPPAAILSVSVLAIGFLVVGSFYSHEETLTLASLYSFGILIAFMLTQAAIIWLRISEPDLPRPFMMKGNVWVGRRLIPVTSVVGVVLSFAAWVVALGTHPGARVVGPLWMLGGLVIYAGTRIRAGLPLIERVEDAVLPLRGRDRHRLLDGRRAARAARRDRGGDDGDGLPSGGGGRSGRRRRERDLRPRP